MIEFNQLAAADGVRPIVLSVENMQTFEPADGGHTSVVLRNGRTILADLAYAEMRRIVLKARSQFVTVLQ